MANVVTDNRTLIASGEVADPGAAGPTDGVWENLGGSTAALDEEISYDTYTGSIGDFCTTTRDGTLWNDGGVGLFSSGDHAYFLINCGIVSLLATKAAGGCTFRVTGATATDWAEFELFGSDEWPNAFDGGWVQVVVDIDELLANPTNTNGSPPTVGNIQRAGFTFITATVMPRMADNFWVGGFAILPANTPAIIVEGRDGGSTDWDWDSVRSVAAVQLSAVLKPGPAGTFVLRGPIQWGISDGSTHAFTDTNKTVLFDFQEVMLDGFYGLSALGDGSGTTNLTFGIKTGTGDDATGAQGGSIQASAVAARFDMDFDDPDVDGVNFYGVQLIHGGDFLLDDPAVSFISTAYIDCDSALVSNSEQLRVQVIDANTADGVGFMTTDDLTDIVFSSFEFSDGHGVTLIATLVTPQTSKGNLYTGYGADDSNDAAVYNNIGSDVVINVTDNGDTPTVRTLANTTVNNTVTLGVTVKDDTGAALEDVLVSIRQASDNALVSQGRTDVAGLYEDTTFAYASDLNVNIEVRKSSPGDTRYFPKSDPATIISTGLSVTVAMTEDANAGIIDSTRFDISKHGQISNDVDGAVITAKVKLPGGSSRKLVVGCGYWDSTANRAVTSLNYDGNAMTSITSSFVQEGSEFHEIFLYRYDIPDADSGEKDVILTLDGAAPFRFLAFAVINLAATGAEEDSAVDSAQSVTSNPSISLNNTTQPAIDVMFAVTDDLDDFPPVASGVGSIRRADKVVDELKQITIVRADRTSTGAHNIGATYDASSKSYVSAGATFAD